jgi:hypothetical protein
VDNVHLRAQKGTEIQTQLTRKPTPKRPNRLKPVKGNWQDHTVAVSRGAYDAQIFTNDREKLPAALGHDVSHSSAHAPEMKPEQKQEQAVTSQREIVPKQEQGEDFGLGL